MWSILLICCSIYTCAVCTSDACICKGGMCPLCAGPHSHIPHPCAGQGTPNVQASKFPCTLERPCTWHNRHRVRLIPIRGSTFFFPVSCLVNILGTQLSPSISEDSSIPGPVTETPVQLAWPLSPSAAARGCHSWERMRRVPKAAAAPSLLPSASSQPPLRPAHTKRPMLDLFASHASHVHSALSRRLAGP